MNFILDENVSFGLVKKLRSDGHNVISVAENHERGLGDDIIFILCRKTKSILKKNKQRGSAISSPPVV